MDFSSLTTSRNLHHTIDVDNDGAFEIPAPIEPYVLQVVAPNGYAEVERTATELPGELRIKPWARLTGRLLQSGKSVASVPLIVEPIRVHATGLPRDYAIRQGVTKVDGSFVIDRVPPIPSSIQAQLHFATPSPLKSTQSVPLQLKPGETIDLTLGGNGSEITGQLVAENQPPISIITSRSTTSSRSGPGSNRPRL